LQHLVAAKSAYLKLVSLRHYHPSETWFTARKLEELQGDIEFDHVGFSYPSRKDRQVLRDFNLVIPAGTCVALIGDSGSGKSTVVQLLERFYRPDEGKIVVDGEDLSNLNIEWWRSQVSFVPQEPVLFYGTILENISISKPEATMDEVIKATTAAHAHEFISKLPKGFVIQLSLLIIPFVIDIFYQINWIYY
jgi:ATP-binding cassette subfamily B (MDR/TAP) protein 1